MEYLIASLVGAVIGYFTNWLAIKMLFRPHEEKRFLGLKLPFTPGLIPKERRRIAKSVGETVGSHLLTGDSIKKALSGEKINNQLRLWIHNNIANLKKSTLTIGENIKVITGEKCTDIISGMEQKAVNLALEKLREEKTREGVLLSLEAYIDEELRTEPRKLFEDKHAVNLKINILNKLEAIKNSDEFKERLQVFISEKLKEIETSDKRIDQIVPEGILAGIKSYIYNNREDISAGIGEMLKQPDMENRIKKVISSIISSNLSPMIAMFINPDMIYGKLASALQEYLLEDENQRNVAMTINQGFDKIVRNNIAEVLSSLEEEEKENNIKDICELIIKDVLTSEFIADIIENMENKLCEFDTLDDILKLIDADYKSYVKRFLEDKINSYVLDERFVNMAEGFVKEGMANILNAKLSDYVGKDEEVIEQVAMNIAGEIFNRFVENEASEMVEVLNIPEIVEERINSFDVEFAEKIIIDIANKELNAITWLGALLGGVIGIVTPLLGKLY